MKATVQANINMALAKYWGKRDEVLALPQTDSLSVTLDNYGSTTTVEFSKSYKRDQFILDGVEYQEGEEYERVVYQLDLARRFVGSNLKAKVVGVNTVVTAAGLASSGSGAAALAAASVQALGLTLSEKDLTMLARQGSGTATRSIHGGFVHWHKGERPDGQDSYAEQIFAEDYWPEFRMILVLVSKQQKKVKSRAGMKQTVATSPYYQRWVETQSDDILQLKKAIKNKNIVLLGQTAETNALKMHALMITTQPTILYWEPTTVAILHHIQFWRDEGLIAYFTMDAGPQVKVICLEKDVKNIESRLKSIPGVVETIVCKPGGGIQYLDRHLF